MEITSSVPQATASTAPPAIRPNPGLNLFAATNYRNQNRKFGIKLDDRRRHMYIVGKTGMGKTTLLENMVLNDIYAGHGVGLVDPHGDFAEKIIDYIPPHRINDVVYFNPADIDYPIGFNILETIRPEQKHLVVSGLMAVFKKIWPDVWSARMEYILNNTILALLDFPGTTLLGINRLLADEVYRRRVVNNCHDPVVKAFWLNEFANYQEKFRTEAVAPIQNKIGQFLSASVIRNIVAQVKSRINIRDIMDTKKIFIMNLSKGRIGEDNSRLLGGMLINRIQLAAMERVEIPELERQDFFLYVDEFQNFATESFAHILSEARKYRLALIMAHQYMEQLEEEVLAAVIGNIGTTLTFRVGSTDAEILAKEFAPIFVEEDLVNLPKYHLYLKLMIDGVASRPFSATTLPPIGSPTASTGKVVRVSRERYAVSRDKIEDKIARWSGMIITGVDDAVLLEVDEDEAMFNEPAAAAAAGKPPALARVLPIVPPRPPAAKTPPAAAAPPAPPPTLIPRPLLPASPALRPTPAFQPAVPHGGSAAAFPPGPGIPGTGKKKRRRKKKKPGLGGAPPPAAGQPVLLPGADERGVSLSSLRPSSLGLLESSAPTAPPVRRSAPMPVPPSLELAVSAAAPLATPPATPPRPPAPPPLNLDEEPFSSPPPSTLPLTPRVIPPNQVVPL